MDENVKMKLWERTGVRVAMFLLTALLVTSSAAAAMHGQARLETLSMNAGEERSFAVLPSVGEAFSQTEFLDSAAFQGLAQSNIWQLVDLFTEYTNENGTGTEAGEQYENAVEAVLRQVYESLEFEAEALYDSVDPQGHLYYWDGGGLDYPYSSVRRDEVKFDVWLLYDEPSLWETPYMEEEESLDSWDLDPYYGDGSAWLKSYDAPGVRDALEALYPKQISEIKDYVAESRQRHYDEGLAELAGTLYYVGDGQKHLSNVELDRRGEPVDMERLTGQTVSVKIEKGQLSASGFRLTALFDELADARLFVVWPDAMITASRAQYEEAAFIIRTCTLVSVGTFVLALALFILLILYTGRRRPAFENTRRLWALDKLFVEGQVLLAVLLFFICAVGAVGVFEASYYRAVYTPLFLVLALALTFAAASAFLWFFLSLIRIGKARLFSQRSLVCRFARGPFLRFANMVKAGYDGRNPLAKTLLLVVSFWFLTMLFASLCAAAWNPFFVFIFGCLLFLTLVAALWFSYRWAGRYGRLRKGISEIAGGNPNYRIEVELGKAGRFDTVGNEFDRLSTMVNALASAQNIAIQNELKTQRLKTDLIANVSHDLKTPLTAIRAYTDLLKTEGLKNKKAEGYLQIIDDKGRRLQKLIEDLFDAAKASSGAITVRPEKIDMKALLEQELAEVNDRFAEASLELVICAAAEHYYAKADSQLLWRVVDNLLRNAVKYAQPATRVYIEFQDTPLMTLSIKNTSATMLNIPPEELMERFKRGDESRTTEGSGLGLAIAKDLVALQGGQFELFIEGDLFKAVVALPPYAESSASHSAAAAEAGGEKRGEECADQNARTVDADV